MRQLLFAASAAALLPIAAAAAELPIPGTEVDAVIVTASRNLEDPAVVARARHRLAQTPGAVSSMRNASPAEISASPSGARASATPITTAG